MKLFNFKEKRKQEIINTLNEVLKAGKEKKKIATQEALIGKKVYKLNLEEIQTKYDLIKVVELLDTRMSFILDEETASRFEKYIIEK